MMRVCLVSTEFAPYNGWGVGAYAAQAARAFARAGHEVWVLTDGSPRLRTELARPAEERRHRGIRFEMIERKLGVAALRHIPCRATRAPMAVFESLRRLHERAPFDYVEFADFYGAGYFAVQARRTVGLFRGTVLAVRLHSPIFVLRELNGQAKLDLNVAGVEHLETETLLGADLVLSPSRAMLDTIRKRVPGLQESRCDIVPYPFDVTATSDLGPIGTPSSGDPEVLFYGRLEFRKGVHLLVDAAQRLMDDGMPLRVRIVGVDTTTGPAGAPMRAWLQELVQKRWHARFAFEDNLPRHHLGEVIGSAAAVCVPSLWENFPNVCLEAMACGKVVVGSDAGGMPEVIEDGVSGLLFRRGSADSLAGVLRRAVTDAALRDRIATGAPARIRAVCDPVAVTARAESAIQRASTQAGEHRAAATSGNPLVSVVIPFFNLASYLAGAVESARSQTWGNLEIIVVDDGSTDAAARELIDRLAAAAPGTPPIRVIRQANRGLSAARNAGLRVAVGKWIVPLDADDLLAPEFVERAIACAALSPGLALVTSWMSCFEDAPDQPKVAYVPLGFDRDMLAVSNVASSCTALLDREAVRGAGGYDETLPGFEDWDLYCSLAERGGRAAVIPEFLIHNRIRPNSMLRSLDAAGRNGLAARVRAKHPELAANSERVRRMLVPAEARRTQIHEPRHVGGLRGLFGRLVRG